MPCRDGNEPWGAPSNCNEHIENGKKWEAGFCALVSTIRTNNGEDILQSLLVVGSKNSGMNLVALYEDHKKDDIARLEKALSKYSNHELAMIKTIITNKKL